MRRNFSLCAPSMSFTCQALHSFQSSLATQVTPRIPCCPSVISPLPYLHPNLSYRSEVLFQTTRAIRLKLYSNWAIFWWLYGFEECFSILLCREISTTKWQCQLNFLSIKTLINKLTLLEVKICNFLTTYLLEFLSHFPCHTTEKLERRNHGMGLLRPEAFTKNAFSQRITDQ